MKERSKELLWQMTEIGQYERFSCRVADGEAIRVTALIKGGIERLRGGSPFLVAETGCVNDRRSGHFRDYVCDHRGFCSATSFIPPSFSMRGRCL